MADTKHKLLEALLKSQKEIEAVTKDGTNPFFKSDYTTLNATIQACKDVLNKNGVVILQPIESDENGVYVCTQLIHSTSGESIDSRMRIIPVKDNDPQAQGSAITYARRYSLKSLLLMSDNDDDAEGAMQRTTAPQPTKQAVSSAIKPDAMQKKIMEQKCRKCGGKMVFNPKTGKTFCAQKCWTK